VNKNVNHNKMNANNTSLDQGNKGSLELELARFDNGRRVALCEALDRVLNKGIVVAGEVTISVAGVDLVYLGLQLTLMSVETARKMVAQS
jgi:hypothetical protein